MLEIKNLHVRVADAEILKGIDLKIGPGEVHAIMGPNGSGKSTLSNVLTGREGYEITDGSITFLGQDLNELEADARAHAGIFLAFQYPMEIPGVPTTTFLRSAVNAHLRARGQDELSAGAFLKRVRELAKPLKVTDAMLKRAVNEDFSGGEKKRAEILQMSLLEPKLAILDETDSGLDIDALKLVSEGVNALRADDRSFIVITHYQRLLDHIAPDFVHVLSGGRIVQSGGPELALELEKSGYAAYGEKAA